MRAAARTVVALIVSGALAAVVFLIMIQGSFHEGFTDLDFSEYLGSMVEGRDLQEAGATDALGQVAASVGPASLNATFAAALVLMAFHGLVIARLVRGWMIQALVLGAVASLVLGLVFCPIADARLDVSLGLFGVDAGGITPVVLVLSSLGFGLIGARCYSLIVSARWWEVHETDAAQAIEGVAGLEPAEPAPSLLLELPEERAEQRRMGP